MNRHEIARRKRALGQFFTPPELARQMARGLWEDWQAGQSVDGAALPTSLTPPTSPTSSNLSAGPSLLDPACGDGALLRAAAEEWARRLQCPAGPDNPGEVVATAPARPLPRLSGVECDPMLVTRCRSLWPADLAMGLDLARESITPPTPFVHWGDALTGPGFDDADARDDSADPRAPGPGFAPPIDWKVTFPTEAAGGGFDLILGNPPYLRERGHRALFESLARTSLGRRWQQPRMDLAHYFLHRALDLLKPGGCLAFVMSVYWTRADSAAPLLERLRTETQPLEWIHLGNRDLFPGVQGHHAVFRLRRCLAGSTEAAGGPQFARLRTVDTSGPLEAAWQAAEVRTLPVNEFFDAILEPTAHRVRLAIRHPVAPVASRPDAGVLEEEFEVRQGIAENPPRITRAQRRTWPDLPPVGTGVFVLTTDELRQLGLSPAEETLVRPYHRPQAIQRYHLAPQPVEWLLYLTRQTAPRLAECPAIARHLARFQSLLEVRREVTRGLMGWWHLHWPREERLFQQPKVLGIQMGTAPRFAFVPQPAYTGFSTHVIVPRSDTASRPLPVLTALLNSQGAHDWFAARAKQRGVKFDLSGGLLRRFPLPARDADQEQAIEALVRQAARQPDPRLDQELDRLVRPWWS